MNWKIETLPFILEIWLSFLGIPNWKKLELGNSFGSLESYLFSETGTVPSLEVRKLLLALKCILSDNEGHQDIYLR